MAGRGRPEAVPLYATERNPGRETLGGRVANVSAKMGKPFMPWQRQLADIAREIDPATGGPWYTEVVGVMVRQVGKTTFVRAELTDTCIFVPRATVRYTAQNRIMALERLEHDFYDPLHASPLDAFLDQNIGSRKAGKPGFSKKTGHEYIGFANGSRWRIDSVKSSSGHGPTLNKGAIDEAFAHGDASVEQAMTPAMVTMADAQLYVLSAAGDDTSGYLRGKVDAGRARVQLEATKPLCERRSRTAYIEYSAPLDSDREDPATWWGCSPALGYTIREEKIAAALDSMASEPEQFDRAYLGWWAQRKAPEPVVPTMAWNECFLAEADVDWQGTPLWAVDVAPDRDWSTIGFAAKHPGARVWLEQVAHEQGTSWVVQHLVKLRGMLGGDVVALDGSGAAASLEPDLEAAGFIVRRLSLRDKVDACGAFYDDVLSHLVRHGGDPVLDSALSSAVKRATGDAWTFWRGKSLADITALYAVVLARFVWVQVAGDEYDPNNSTA